MMLIKKVFKIVLSFLVLGLLLLLVLSLRPIPDKIFYGVSFGKYHSDELELNWKEVYTAILTDLGVRKFRLSAHWPMIEPERGVYNFSDLDYQIEEAEKRGAEVILAVGRRLPGWPECHIPEWAHDLSWEEKKKRILPLIENTVNRYKDSPAVKYWQVENEPFLSVFAKEHCGELDKEFLREEIALVKKLDPSRPILVTDSGNLGLWKDAWREGDIFGTSVYMYLWNPAIGQVKSVYRPFWYRGKTNLMELLFGEKKSLLIELSLEPWLLEPIVKTPIDIQIERMNIQKFNEVIFFAKETGFDTQYLWGAEWWYWMNINGHEEYWNEAKNLFKPKGNDILKGGNSQI